MSIVISVSNHKGGVGKTTSCVNIGAGLSRKKKVLLIDLDPQANLSQSLGAISPSDNNTYSLLRGGKVFPEVIGPNLDLIPSTLDLSGAEIELSSEPGREYILREYIDTQRANYEYILIDTPPSLGLLSINAFTSSDYVLLPIQAEYLALQGLKKLVEVIEKVQARLNKSLQIGGVFVTRYDKRKVLNRTVAQAIEKHFKGRVFKTRIRENISLAEAPTVGKDIFQYAEKSHGAEDYKKLTKEIIKKLK